MLTAYSILDGSIVASLAAAFGLPAVPIAYAALVRLDIMKGGWGEREVL